MNFTWAEVLEEAKARGITDLDAVRERYLSFLEQDPEYTNLDPVQRAQIQQQVVGEDEWAIKSFGNLRTDDRYLLAPVSSRQAKFDEIARTSRAYQALAPEQKQKLRQSVVWAPGAAEHDNLDEFEVVAPIIPAEAQSALPTAMDIYLQQANTFPGLRWTPGLQGTEAARTVEARQLLQPRGDADRSLLGEFGSGVQRGATELGASLLEAGGVGADLLGADDAAAGLYDAVSAYEAGKADVLRPARVASVQDIRSPSDALEWLAAGTGEQAPIIGALIAAGMTGGAAVPALTGAGVAAAPTAMTATEAAAAANAIARATQLGQLGAAAIGGTALETGGISRDIRDQGGEAAPGTALAGGAAAGILEALPIFRFLKGAGANNIAREAGEEITKRVLKQAAAEGSTEIAQTLIEQATADWAAQNQGRLEDIRLMTPEGRKATAWEAINAGLLGGLMGGGMGVFGKGPDATTEPPPDTAGEAPAAPPAASELDPRLVDEDALPPLTEAENAELQAILAKALGETAPEAETEAVDLEPPAVEIPQVGSLDETLGQITQELESNEIRAREKAAAVEAAKAQPPQPDSLFTPESYPPQPVAEPEPIDLEKVATEQEMKARGVDLPPGYFEGMDEDSITEKLAEMPEPEVAQLRKILQVENDDQLVRRLAGTEEFTPEAPAPVAPTADLAYFAGQVPSASKRAPQAERRAMLEESMLPPEERTVEAYDERYDAVKDEELPMHLWRSPSGLLVDRAKKTVTTKTGLVVPYKSVMVTDFGTTAIISRLEGSPDKIKVMYLEGPAAGEIVTKSTRILGGSSVFDVGAAKMEQAAPKFEEQRARVEKFAAKHFPDSKVTRTATGMTVESPHFGEGPLRIDFVESIDPTPEGLAQYGITREKFDEDRMVIRGSYGVTTDGDLIKLVKGLATDATTAEEAAHFAWRTALGPEQRAKITRLFPVKQVDGKPLSSEEQAVKYVARNITNPQSPSWVKQIRQWIEKMLDTLGIYESGGRILRKMETGEIHRGREVVRDRQNQQGLRGEERVRQEAGRPVQEQGRGNQAAPAGRVLQAQGQVALEVTREEAQEVRAQEDQVNQEAVPRQRNDDEGPRARSSDDEARRVQDVAGERLDIASLADTVRTKTGEIMQTDAGVLQGIYDAVYATKAGKKFLHDFLDKHLSIAHLVKSLEGNKPADTLNAYQALRNLTAVTSAKLDRFKKEHVTPIAEAIGRLKLEMKDVNDFLRARHVFERNAHVFEQLSDEIKASKKRPVPGAGNTDADARKILNDLRSRGLVTFSGEAGVDTVYGGKLGQVGNLVSKAVTAKEQLMIEGGLIESSVVQAMRKAYRYYVPLKGPGPTPLEIAGYDEILHGGSDNITRSGERRATGRRTEAKNPPLEQLLLDTGATIVRNEHNAARKVLLALVEAHPDAVTEDGRKMFEVDRDRTFRVRGKDGKIREQKDTREDDRAVTVWVDGVRHDIRVADETLLAALNGTGVPKTGDLVRTMGTLNRWFARVNTSWNPAFIVPNFARDFGTAMIRLSDPELKQYQSAVFSGWPKAASIAYRATAGKKLTAEEQAAWDDFREAGGMVGFWMTPDIESQTKELAELGLKAQRDPKSAAAYAIRLGETVKAANTAAENALRFATYLAATSGPKALSKPQAAMLSRNLTVDFNRMGNYSSAMGSFFLFFNASMQGSAVVLGSMTKSPTIRRIASGLVVSGFAHAFAMRALMGKDDDDGEWYWDKIPSYVKERNIVIPLPGAGKYAKFPLPYGFNVPWVMGTSALEAATGGKPPLQAAGQVVSAAAGAFNPLGGVDLSTAKGWVNTFTPTAGDPVVDILGNENFFGAPIRPDRMPWESGKPDSELYFHSVTRASKEFTSFLNRLTGGDEYSKGWADWNPENIDYLFGSIIGGTGKTLGQGVNAVLSAVGGRRVEVSQAPIFNRFFGEESNYHAQEVYYGNQTLLEETKTRLKQYREKYPDQVEPLRDEYAWLLRSEGRLKSIEAAIKKAKAAGDEATVTKLQKQANKELRLAQEKQEAEGRER